MGADEELGRALVEVWRRVLLDDAEVVEMGGRSYRVGRSRRAGLRMLTVVVGNVEVEGIEQNPATKSRWAKMAQDGQRIMQFKVRGRYVANVAEGRLTRYPAWKGLGLSDSPAHSGGGPAERVSNTS